MRDRGYILMADVVIALAREPRTGKQLYSEFEARIGFGPLRRMLRRLLDGKVLRISAWVGDRNAERVYAVGSEPSVPAPTHPRRNGSTRRPHRAPQTPARPMYVVARFCAIWHALETPCTVQDICDEIDSSSPSVIRPVLQRLQSAKPKLVRIVGYESEIQRTVIYQLGSKPDAPRPAPISEHVSYMRAKQKRAAFDQHRVFSFLQPATA